MATFPNYAAGQRITAALLQSGQTNVLFQAADQTVTNSLTLVASPDLAFQAVANATYILHVRASYSSVIAADARFHWIGPSGGSFQKYTLGADLTGATDFGSAATTGLTMTMQRRSSTVAAPGGGGATAFMDYHEDTIFRNGSTAGLLSFAFAQNTANATGTILRADSMIEYYRIA